MHLFRRKLSASYIIYGGSGRITSEQCSVDVDSLFHDLLLRSYFYHYVWSVKTAHNLTPEKRDSNYNRLIK